jgi:hypothetical protein
VQESHLMMLEPYKQALSEYQAKYN